MTTQRERTGPAETIYSERNAAFQNFMVTEAHESGQLPDNDDILLTGEHGGGWGGGGAESTAAILRHQGTK